MNIVKGEKKNGDRRKERQTEKKTDRRIAESQEENKKDRCL